MDGWGHGEDKDRSAIAHAKTPFVDSLYSKYPNSELITYGESVGLPHGQMGNSEVGHLNIGAGRVVFQDLLKINNAIHGGEFQKNGVLITALQAAKKRNAGVHLMGLVSSGGVHSHIEHLYALIDCIHNEKISRTYIHAFTDGRDSDPHSGKKHIENLQKKIEDTNVQLASIIGRYYAMDRDHRWERIKLAYDLMVYGKGEPYSNPVDAISMQYALGQTDEFLKPMALVDGDDNPVGCIKKDDLVICFNFRTDRCRQISEVFTQLAVEKYDMKPLDIAYVTMTRYDEDYKNIEVIFENENLQNTLGQVLEQNNLTQLRIAETEKYPHVTFFFSGGQEEPFQGEKRILVASPKVATYDLKPEMSAYELTEKLLPELKDGTFDFICLNFANTDMVGHTGVFSAAVKAAETVDQCVEQIVVEALKSGYSVLLTADHGNADCMINENGTPHTAHTKNPVPLFYISNSNDKNIKEGKLGDLAPTILKLMDIDVPNEMTGENLLKDE